MLQPLQTCSCHYVASSVSLTSILWALKNIQNAERFIMFSLITNIYNKKTKGSTLMELFTATGKLK
jgi:predicted DNA-binding ribbon-helix-helix protein